MAVETRDSWQSVRFILGRAGTGKTRHILEQIEQFAKRDDPNERHFVEGCPNRCILTAHRDHSLSSDAKRIATDRAKIRFFEK